MAIHPALVSRLFVHTVTLEPFVSRDVYGKPTYGAPITVKAKIEKSEEQLLTPEGQSLVSSRKVFLASQDTSITPEWRLTLPAGFGPTQPQILQVRPVNDHNGVNHIVLIT